MNDFRFVSDRYSTHQTQNYRLSIQFNPDGFSVLIDQDGSYLKILHRQSGSQDESIALFKQEEELIQLRKLNFKSRILLFNDNRAMMIPAELDDETRIKEIFAIEFSSVNNHELKKQQIPGTEISLLFSLNPAESGFAASFAGTIHTSHLILPLISQSLEHDEPAICIYSSAGLVHLCRTKRGMPEFQNSFSCANDDEILYHIMNSLRAGNFLMEDPIFYAGHFDKKGTHINLLKKYLPGLSQMKNPFSFELAWPSAEHYFHYLQKV